MSTLREIVACGAELASSRFYMGLSPDEHLDNNDDPKARAEDMLVARFLDKVDSDHERMHGFLRDESARLQREGAALLGHEVAAKLHALGSGQVLHWLCCWIEQLLAKKLNHFGRLLPVGPDHSAPGVIDDYQGRLKALADSMHEGFGGAPGSIPVGFVFFGQFIDHDITLDAVTQLSDHGVDVEGIMNLRTPALDLDSLYRDGPEASPYLYDQRRAPGYLLTGPDCRDLPRNSQGRALIGDPRNDENAFVSQLHLQLLLFHNGIRRLIEHSNVDSVFGRRAGEDDFNFARRMTRWHYQWIVVNEYLPHIVSPAALDAAHAITGVPKGTTLVPPLAAASPFAKAGKVLQQQSWVDCCGARRCGVVIPVEFSGAAFRFAHSQVPGRLDIHDARLNIPRFVPSPPAPGAFNPASSAVDWRRFFALQGSAPQLARPIDTFLDAQLFQLPFAADEPSLALRNLMRSTLTYRVASAEQASAVLGLPLTLSQAGTDQLKLAGLPGPYGTPLWFYVLAEAAASGGKLGPIGGLLVAWTLLNMLRCDRSSYVHEATPWKPVMLVSSPGAFTMADLLHIAEGERVDACPPSA
ncbi:MAG: peroxidase family protein [Nannocystaceae bacterium]